MGLVDHQQGLVPLLHVDQLGQIGDVAVHAVDALDDDQHAAILAAELGQHPLGGLGVVVRERPPPRAGKDRPLDDAVVGQGVVQDEVARADEVADDRLVRGVAADEASTPPRRRGTRAIARSNSPCNTFSPEARRLAETLVP